MRKGIFFMHLLVFWWVIVNSEEVHRIHLNATYRKISSLFIIPVSWRQYRLQTCSAQFNTAITIVCVWFRVCTTWHWHHHSSISRTHLIQGFKKTKQQQLNFSLATSSLEASKPLNLFIESHQQYSYWYLIYMGFFLLRGQYTFCTSFTHIHMNCVISHKAISPQMEKKKETLAFNDGHETHLINSYDADLR